jgi:hypothetical protein
MTAIITNKVVIGLLISQDTNKQVNRIIGQCYNINRILDRMLSVMSVNFACVESVEILHLKFSHKFPLLGDFFYDLQADFNVLTEYPMTISESTNYNTLYDIFQRVLAEILILNELIVECIEICEEERDINIKASLCHFLATTYSKYIKQAIIMRDKSNLYGDNTLDFDRDFHKFFILE